MIDNDTKILITGSAGFLGTHVVKVFEEYRDGHIDGGPYNITILTPTHNDLDLMISNSVRLYLLKHQPDIIIHLAAQCGGIGINSKKPGEFLYNNLTMTTNLIEWCRRLKGEFSGVRVKKFVGIGTVCSYPKYTPVPFREENLYDGYPEETNASYGLSKRMQLDMLKAYRAQYGFNGIYLIPVNMCGEYDNFNDDTSHVIPAMLKKFHNAKVNGDSSVTLWGDGSASREFLYAGDAADAILRATLFYNGAEPVNIGIGKEITIKALAEKVKRVVEYKGEIKWDITKPNGQPRRCLDVSRARREFGFRAQTTLYRMLYNSYEWAKENDVL